MPRSTSTGLGKGFDALFPSDLDVSIIETESTKIRQLDVAVIEPNPEQPRRIFDPEALEQLAGSIKKYGVLQPVIVTPNKKRTGVYVLIAGERRWRASQLAGLSTMPALVRTAPELEQLEVALIENIQRVDLSPLEQAASIKRLHDQFTMSYDDISKRLGKATSTINNIVRLLQLTPAAQQALQDQKISEGHARSLLALKDYPRQQEELLLLVIKHGWSVRQAEQFVTATKANATNSRAASKHTRSSTPQTEALSKLLKRPVTISNMAKGGRLVIRFSSQDDLEALIATLQTLKKSP